MEHLRNLRLLDEEGKPLDLRIETVLRRLVPRFRRRFPSLHDDLAVTEVFEEAGRKIAQRERHAGPIEKLHGYAWVTLRTVAASWLRRGSNRVAQNALRSDEVETVLTGLPAEFGTADQIERGILLKEVGARLTPDERVMLGWKRAGFSSAEIAAFRGTTPNAVNIVFSRIRRKIANLLRVQQYGAVDSQRAGGGQRKRPNAPVLNDTDTE